MKRASSSVDDDYSIILGFFSLLLLATCYAWMGGNVLQLLYLWLPGIRLSPILF
jgi:hypothetical protein